MIPDIADPAGSARIEVSEQTPRRPNDRATWEEAGDRPDRAVELLQAIEAQLSV